MHMQFHYEHSKNAHLYEENTLFSVLVILMHTLSLAPHSSLTDGSTFFHLSIKYYCFKLLYEIDFVDFSFTYTLNMYSKTFLTTFDFIFE